MQKTLRVLLPHPTNQHRNLPPPGLPGPKFNCTCGAALCDLRRLQGHVKKNKDPWWRCGLSTCGAVFDTMTSYEAHMMARESGNDGHVSTLEPIVSQMGMSQM
jgi:hypothetical protein